jgi:predicted metalloenzyme YecM
MEILLLRNKLYHNHFSTDDLEMIYEVRREILGCESLFKEILLNCINNCIKDIDQNNFMLAFNELNFIHNLPFEKRRLYEHEEWTLIMLSLPSYLDKTESLERNKKIILLVSEAIIVTK